MKKYWLMNILMILMIGGCSMKSPHPIDIFTLKNNITLDKKHSSIFPDKVLKIALPQSTKEIKTNKILYTKTANQREAYAYSRWSDTPNHMIEQFLVTLLNQNKLFKAVLPASSIANSDFILESNIEDFYQIFDNEKQSFAVVKISFFLIDQKDKKVIAKHSIKNRVPASSLDAKGGVEAFNNAVGQVGKKLTKWLRNSYVK
jgi:cholesterol transport system auxiliary component